MQPRVMMWANYRRGPSLAVPGPTDDKSSPYWWYDRIAELAPQLAAVGFTEVLFPNPIKGQSGSFRTGDGYNPFDDYDIGSKNQMGGVPTRFGDANQLRRAIAICHANGLDVLLDIVNHQRMGGKNGVYRYVGADGKTLNGRFPKDPPCFRGSLPRVPEDPVPSPLDDYAFGDELCPVNAKPDHYVWNGLIDAGDWLFRTTGADGGRLDDMKGMNIEFIRAYISSKEMANHKWYFGEYASGNRNDTVWWVDQVSQQISAADFDFHYNMVQPMCNLASNFNMGSLAGRGMIGVMPMKAVAFVESMDSDTNGFATVVSNKELGYALLLTGEGLPCVYVRDYLREPDCYGLKYSIQNLVWCHTKLAVGPTVPRYQSQHLYVFERMGLAGTGPGCIVALNGDVFNPAWQLVTVQTHFGPNVQLHDFTGHNSQDSRTDANGRATFGVPPGANGEGYGVWSVASMEGSPIQVKGRRTTQTFFGAWDLDIPPMRVGQTQNLPQVWCAANSTVEVSLSSEVADVRISVIGPDGTAIQNGVTKEEGWYYVQFKNPNTNGDFELKMTYQAPQHFRVPKAF